MLANTIYSIIFVLEVIGQLASRARNTREILFGFETIRVSSLNRCNKNNIAKATDFIIYLFVFRDSKYAYIRYSDRRIN